MCISVEENYEDEWVSSVLALGEDYLEDYSFSNTPIESVCLPHKLKEYAGKKA